MIPRPSQPRSKKIKLGIKISRSIERTNARTNKVKREINGSLVMYERENSRTFPEMNRMMVAKMEEAGSRMTGMAIWWVVRENKFHSRSRVLCFREINRESKKDRGAHISSRRGASRGMENMVRDNIYLQGHSLMFWLNYPDSRESYFNHIGRNYGAGPSAWIKDVHWSIRIAEGRR